MFEKQILVGVASVNVPVSRKQFPVSIEVLGVVEGEKNA
jgi:hypothetical protein